MKDRIIYYIDEDEDQRMLMPERLKEAFGSDVDIHAIEPKTTIDEMTHTICEIASLNHLCALVFDERLSDTGDANYRGSQLAKAYRDFDPVIPIYILTSYADDEDLQVTFSSYDYVLEKDHFVDKAPKSIQNVLRRNLGKFENYVSERSTRLHELIEDSVLTTLSKEKSKELNKLLKWKFGPTYLIEHESQAILKQELDESEEKLNVLIAKANKL